MKPLAKMLLNAAKAAGVQGVFQDYEDTFGYSCGVAPKGAMGRDWWNPLNSGGQALELAAKLGFRIYVYNGGGDDCTIVASDELDAQDVNIKIAHNGDNLAATRLAIVKAAALIGELK